MRDPFDLRGRVCCPWGCSEAVTVVEAGVASHVAWGGYAMFSGIRGHPECCATSAELSDEHKFQAH